ncbi:hypothetical protein Bbelb_391500 [Branchiostoma belcheri]|nr:hypothetical protein Bbelb_391500 [Branchiostoma belcheri]
MRYGNAVVKVNLQHDLAYFRSRQGWTGVQFLHWLAALIPGVRVKSHLWMICETVEPTSVNGRCLFFWISLKNEPFSITDLLLWSPLGHTGLDAPRRGHVLGATAVLLTLIKCQVLDPEVSDFLYTYSGQYKTSSENLPGTCRVPAGDRPKRPMRSRLLSPTGTGRGYIPDGHRRNWGRSISRIVHYYTQCRFSQNNTAALSKVAPTLALDTAVNCELFWKNFTVVTAIGIPMDMDDNYIKCNICEETGHAGRACQLSFVNRLSMGISWGKPVTASTTSEHTKSSGSTQTNPPGTSSNAKSGDAAQPAQADSWEEQDLEGEEENEDENEVSMGANEEEGILPKLPYLNHALPGAGDTAQQAAPKLGTKPPREQVVKSNSPAKTKVSEVVPTTTDLPDETQTRAKLVRGTPESMPFPEEGANKWMSDTEDTEIAQSADGLDLKLDESGDHISEYSSEDESATKRPPSSSSSESEDSTTSRRGRQDSKGDRQKTWLSDEIADSDIALEGYQAHRKDQNRHGGGVMIYVSDYLYTTRAYSSRAKRLNTKDAWATYRRQRNLVTNLTRRAETVYIKDLVNDVETGSTRRFFTYAKSALGKTSTGIPALQVDSVISETPEVKAALNNFFIKQTDPPSRSDPTPTFLPTTVPDSVLDSLQLSEEEVRQQLRTLQVGKSGGHDKITPRLLRLVADPISVPLTRLYNKSLLLGQVPTEWKKANYGSPVWAGLPRCLSDEVERFQKLCLRICGVPHGYLPTLESRRREGSLREIKRILQDPTNPCNDFIPPRENSKLEANIDKCKVMLITTRALPQLIPPVILGGSVLQVVTSHKHLGVTLGNTLSWSQHIEFRRKFHTAVTMYKLLNGRCPPHLQNLLPRARASATESRYLLRNSEHLSIPVCRTTRSQRTFVIRAITIWNALPSDTRTARSVSSFKNKLWTIPEAAT